MLCDEIGKFCLQTNKEDLIRKNYNVVVGNIQMASDTWDWTETGNNGVETLSPRIASVELADNDISPLQFRLQT